MKTRAHRELNKAIREGRFTPGRQLSFFSGGGGSGLFLAYFEIETRIVNVYADHRVDPNIRPTGRERNEPKPYFKLTNAR